MALDIVYKDVPQAIKRGDDIALVFDEIVDSTGSDVDLSTGYTAKLQARNDPDDTSAIISLTDSSGLTLGDGKVTATITSTNSAAYTFDSAHYELEVTSVPGGEVKTIRGGTIKLVKDYCR